MESAAQGQGGYALHSLIVVRLQRRGSTTGGPKENREERKGAFTKTKKYDGMPKREKKKGSGGKRKKLGKEREFKNSSPQITAVKASNGMPTIGPRPPTVRWLWIMSRIPTRKTAAIFPKYSVWIKSKRELRGHVSQNSTL